MAAQYRVLGLKRLAAIILRSPADGMAFANELAQSVHSTVAIPEMVPVEHPDDSVWMEFEVYNVKVCWPVNKLARGAGEVVWT